MKIHLFSTTNLIEALAKGSLSLKMKSSYLLAGSLLNILIGYSTLTGSNAGRTWFAFYEFVALMMVTVYGFRKCISAANGQDDGNFIVDFVCLSLPVSISTSVIVWGGHLAVWLAYGRVVTTMTFDANSQQTANDLIWINNNLPRFTVFFAMILSTALYYLRIARCLSKVRVLRQKAMQARALHVSGILRNDLQE